MMSSSPSVGSSLPGLLTTPTPATPSPDYTHSQPHLFPTTPPPDHTLSQPHPLPTPPSPDRTPEPAFHSPWVSKRGTFLSLLIQSFSSIPTSWPTLLVQPFLSPSLTPCLPSFLLLSLTVPLSMASTNLVRKVRSLQTPPLPGLYILASFGTWNWALFFTYTLQVIDHNYLYQRKKYYKKS